MHISCLIFVCNTEVSFLKNVFFRKDKRELIFNKIITTVFKNL